MKRINQEEVTAMILAAGQSQRFVSAGPKVLQPLAGGPCALQRVLKVCRACPELRAWVCVAQPEVILRLSEFPEGEGVQSVLGGHSRAASVLKGLEVVQSPWVLIHDAARPLLTLAMLEQLLAYRDEKSMEGVAFGTPLRDSLKRVSSQGQVLQPIPSPPIDAIWLTHTPQLFPTALLLRLARQIQKSSEMVWRDEVEWASDHGYTPLMIHSPEINWKLTYPEDKLWVERLLKGRAIA